MAKKRKINTDIVSESILEQIASNAINKNLSADDIISQLMGWIMQKMLEKELEAHLGYSKYQRGDKNNYRNWYYDKTVKSDFGEINLSIPRDRNWTFEPIVAPKKWSILWDIQSKIIMLYSKWMSLYDISDTLFELYKVSLSETTISELIDEILDEVNKWKNRQLEEAYPIIYIDAIYISLKEDWKVKKKPVYFIMWYDINWMKDLLWMYILSDTESAKDWIQILNDIRNRWVETIWIVVTDNLTWVSKAIKWVFPEADIQKCVVHQVRNSLNRVSWKDRKELAKDMKVIYTASNEKEAEERLVEFSKKWENKAPIVVRSWNNNWEELKTFLKYPEEIRKLIYTTNPIESLNYQFRKYTKVKSVIPNEESAYKILYLAMRNITKKWTRPYPNWHRVIYQLNIFKEGLFDKYL